ncbi:MAG: GNAT family N-acetyltransferase [Armatimonadetes bacterium]|nr:GNAT family N-acetyltransferase [Armatimonadota bacterium]
MIELRPATIPDAEALSVLATTTFHDGWADIIGTAAAHEYTAHYLTPGRLTAEIADRDTHFYLLAFSDAALLGYAKLDFARPTHGSVTGERPVLLQRLYVAASGRGTGVADTLLTGIEEVASRRGYETLWLECDPRNVRAWRFYEKRGFVARDKVAYILPGGQNDEVRVMERGVADALGW